MKKQRFKTSVHNRKRFGIDVFAETCFTLNQGLQLNSFGYGIEKKPCLYIGGKSCIDK